MWKNFNKYVINVLSFLITEIKKIIIRFFKYGINYNFSNLVFYFGWYRDVKMWKLLKFLYNPNRTIGIHSNSIYGNQRISRGLYYEDMCAFKFEMKFVEADRPIILKGFYVRLVLFRGNDIKYTTYDFIYDFCMILNKSVDGVVTMLISGNDSMKPFYMTSKDTSISHLTIHIKSKKYIRIINFNDLTVNLLDEELYKRFIGFEQHLFDFYMKSINRSCQLKAIYDDLLNSLNSGDDYSNVLCKLNNNIFKFYKKNMFTSIESEYDQDNFIHLRNIFFGRQSMFFIFYIRNIVKNKERFR